MMPPSRRQSTEAKKRLQHLLYLARESPAATFDISSCEITEVPQGVFSLCKVLQKEALLLHNNWLTSLKEGGKMQDLAGLRVLDLHDNELSSLPDEIVQLQSLQVFNLQNNRLTSLPSTIYQLQSLQTLNVGNNRLKALPTSVSGMRSLRTLDVSCNLELTRLPAELCHVRTLENLVVDPSKMQYPSSRICFEGTTAIMKYLCAECGVQYYPPSNYLLNVLNPPKPVEVHLRSNSLKAKHSDVTDTVSQYENVKERKRLERLELEKELSEYQQMQAQLALQATSNKTHLLQYVSKDQERMSQELSSLFLHKEQERRLLLQTMHEEEKNASNLVVQLLVVNEKARKTEELLDKMERERNEAEQWFIIRQEEMENVRKKDVLAAMEATLKETDLFTRLVTRSRSDRDAIALDTHRNLLEVDGRLDDFLTSKDLERQSLVDKLMKEEALQKEAFEALQFQKDARHKRLTEEILLVERQLAEITLLEVKERQLKMDIRLDVLEEKRHALTQLLIMLLQERDKRAVELLKRLAEIEAQRLANQADYWLVQYQRLMDRKPEELMDQERQLEIAVVKIVEQAGASDKLYIFARHRISIETLVQMTDDGLKQIGIYEAGLRRSLLAEISKYKARVEEEEARKMRSKKKEKEIENDWLVKPPGTPAKRERQRIPSAPEDKTPSPQSPDVVARGVNSECVVCMEMLSTVLFLNCGHVCCCQRCAEPMAECPLCRGAVVQRIQLSAELKLAE